MCWGTGSLNKSPPFCSQTPLVVVISLLYFWNWIVGRLRSREGADPVEPHSVRQREFQLQRWNLYRVSFHYLHILIPLSLSFPFWKSVFFHSKSSPPALGKDATWTLNIDFQLGKEMRFEHWLPGLKWRDELYLPWEAILVSHRCAPSQ